MRHGNGIWAFIFAIAIGCSSIAVAQQAPAKPKPKAQHPKADRGKQPDMGEILVRGLKATHGCLGVKTCRWDDGKQSIVAWFEDKDAAATWYHSATHQAMIGDQTDGYDGEKEPLEHVADDGKPIMVIASLTFAERPMLPNMKLPISQISIELFQPLPGGAQVAGRVSPPQVMIPHMKDYTPKKEPVPSEKRDATDENNSK